MNVYNIILVIFLIVLLLIINFFMNKTKKENFQVTFPIDVVYTWVESNSEFEKEKEEYSKKANINYSLANRYQDHEELKYSLRSIEKNFPYFRNIYIVVKDGQFPKYLKKDHPKLKVINHSEIIPKQFLPTFSSLVIEQYLHKIPELSEHYLYLNDDNIILNELTPDYFFNDKGVIYATKGGLVSSRISDYDKYKNTFSFMDNIRINNQILDKIGKYEKTRHHIQHVPKMYKKSLDEKMEERLKTIKLPYSKNNIFDATSENKFRKNTDLCMNVMIKYYLYKYWYNYYDKKGYDEVYIDVGKNDEDLDQVLTRKNKFLCINDQFDYTNQEKVNKTIKKFHEVFNKKFPEKSSFEI